MLKLAAFNAMAVCVRGKGNVLRADGRMQHREIHCGRFERNASFAMRLITICGKIDGWSHTREPQTSMKLYAYNKSRLETQHTRK